MNPFRALLNILQRDFNMEQETDHGNGFIQRRYSDETGQAHYTVEVYEDTPRTIIAPDKTQYYANGGKQEFPRRRG